MNSNPAPPPIPSPSGSIAQPLMCSRCRLPALEATEKNCRACGAPLTAACSGPSAANVLYGIVCGFFGLFFLLLTLRMVLRVILEAAMGRPEYLAGILSCIGLVAITALFLVGAVRMFRR